MQQDPIFYKHFSEILKEAIRAYHEERIREKEYLTRVGEVMNAVVNRTGDDVPDLLTGHEVGKAYFGIVNEALKAEETTSNQKESYAKLALEIERIIDRNRIVNWEENNDIQNRMRNEIEDILFDWKEQEGLLLSFEQIDQILDQCIDVARVRLP